MARRTRKARQRRTTPTEREQRHRGYAAQRKSHRNILGFQAWSFGLTNPSRSGGEWFSDLQLVEVILQRSGVPSARAGPGRRCGNDCSRPRSASTGTTFQHGGKTPSSPQLPHGEWLTGLAASLSVDSRHIAPVLLFEASHGQERPRRCSRDRQDRILLPDCFSQALGARPVQSDGLRCD
jgi:hypothetical protein